MNAVDMAKMAYGSGAAPVRTARATEYAVFAQVTRQIKQAAARGPDGFRALAAALHDNRRLWTALAVDVADAGNALPEGLRAQIFYLNEFVAVQTRRILRGEARADALVDINTAIMRGLAGEGRPS